MSAAYFFSGRVSAAGLAPGLGPFLVGGLVWGIGLSLGGPTGYAINPARDLGPRHVCRQESQHAQLGRAESLSLHERFPLDGRRSCPQ